MINYLFIDVSSKAFLQRIKEVKQWCRKLLKKIRNNKYTMERKTSTDQDHSTQLVDDYDDIYISDDDDFEEQIICHNSSDEEDQVENNNAEK